MLITIRGRLSFPSIWSPSSVSGGPEMYRARILIDPADTATVKLIRDTRKQVATDKWKAKGAVILDMNKGDKNKESWFESDYRSLEGEVYAGCAGMYHLSTLADIQPTIIDRDRTELTKRDGRPYNGCYCVFKVDIWAQDNANGKAVRAGLAGIQFWKDGEAFGGGVRASVDSFEDLTNLGEDEAPATAAASRKPAEPEADEDDIA